MQLLVGKAHLLSGLRFVDGVDKALSVGPNKKNIY